MRQVEIVPAGDMGGQVHALALEIHRTAEADSAAIEIMARFPLFNDDRDAIEYGFVGRVRFALDDVLAFKHRHAELRSANVDGERAHAGNSEEKSSSPHR